MNWQIIRQQLDNIFYKGTKAEYTPSKNNIIYTTNVIFLHISANLFLATFIMIAFTKFYWGAFGLFVTLLMFMLSVFLNIKGYHLIAKVGVLIYLCNAVIITNILFSHNTVLFVSLLQVSYVCVFIFDESERKWSIFVTAFAIVYMIVEVSSLRTYLPDYNLIPKDSLFAANTVYSLGHISHAVGLSIIYVSIIKDREMKLKSLQNELIDSQKKLLMHAEDLESFSTIAVHDLKSPINNGIMMMNILEKKLADEYSIDEEYKDAIHQIKGCFSSMGKISIDLLSYSKVMYIDTTSEVINIENELNTIYKNIYLTYPNAILELNPLVNEIMVNKMLFYVVMQNLIENGFRYNNSVSPKVVIKTELILKTVQIHIMDNGIGIPPEYIDNIFKPFIMRTYLPKVRNKGTGLGLSGAKRAADRLKGKLYCYESNHKGSHFIFELPFIHQ